eukprot:COSAG01_NODE_21881_length_881_cov_0.985934_2_plen_82_part_01
MCGGAGGAGAMQVAELGAVRLAPPVQNRWLLRRGGGQHRRHSLANCNHGGSSGSQRVWTTHVQCAQPSVRAQAAQHSDHDES